MEMGGRGGGKGGLKSLARKGELRQNGREALSRNGGLSNYIKVFLEIPQEEKKKKIIDVFIFLILLQCPICSLYRKNNHKKVTTYLLLHTYCKFF